MMLLKKLVFPLSKKILKGDPHRGKKSNSQSCDSPDIETSLQPRAEDHS